MNVWSSAIYRLVRARPRRRVPLRNKRNATIARLPAWIALAFPEYLSRRCRPAVFPVARIGRNVTPLHHETCDILPAQVTGRMRSPSIPDLAVAARPQTAMASSATSIASGRSWAAICVPPCDHSRLGLKAR